VLVDYSITGHSLFVVEVLPGKQFVLVADISTGVSPFKTLQLTCHESRLYSPIFCRSGNTVMTMLPVQSSDGERSCVNKTNNASVLASIVDAFIDCSGTAHQIQKGCISRQTRENNRRRNYYREQPAVLASRATVVVLFL
jgi:hypothetical protein